MRRWFATARLGDVSFLNKLLHLVTYRINIRCPICKKLVCGAMAAAEKTPQRHRRSRVREKHFTTKRIELALDRVQQRARRERAQHERREAADDQLRLELLARVLDGDADLADDRSRIIGLLRDDAVEPARKSNQ